MEKNQKEESLLDRRLAGFLFILLKEIDERDWYGCAVCVIDTSRRLLKKDDGESLYQVIDLHAALPMETQVIGHFKRHTDMVSAVTDAQNAALGLWKSLVLDPKIKHDHVHAEGEPVMFGKYIVAVDGPEDSRVRDFVGITCLALLMYRDAHGEDMPYEILSDYKRFIVTIEETLDGLSSDFLRAYGFSQRDDEESPLVWPGIAWEFTFDMWCQLGMPQRNISM
ncbi:MAG: hypothetical protein HGA67_02270 [Candidatus Yonathbacteria bacterium]|nr:hypothetical protein [Candidatus Yonathbacteria bacterium]